MQRQLLPAVMSTLNKSSHSKKERAEFTCICVLIECPGIQHKVHVCCPVPVHAVLRIMYVTMQFWDLGLEQCVKYFDFNWLTAMNGIPYMDRTKYFPALCAHACRV